MAHGRDPRLNRRCQEDYKFELGIASDRGRSIRGQPSRATATGHSRPTEAHRFSEVKVNDGDFKARRKTEKFDYGHRRDRSRSPFAIADHASDYRKKQQCETDAIPQNESIQITVGNDKFKSSFSDRLLSQKDTLSQSSLTAVSRTSHDRHDYVEETPSVTRAREMALRTREMLSKLTGWTPLSLQPLSTDHVTTTERPGFVNISNSVYTKVSASSEVAQSILRNISAVAAAFCPKESGGVTHIKYKKMGKMRKSTTADDDNKFSYSENLVSERIENTLSGADERQLKCCEAMSGNQSLNLAEPSNKKTNDSECDPVVANVLKSIGFNFELSKIMQEKAKKERVENEKNRVLIQQASSFLAKQVAGKSHNAQEVSTDDNIALATRHIGDDLNETLRRNNADILYDDFSNSEDEFSGTENKKWTASSTKSELSLGKDWRHLQMADSSPSVVGFPSGVPSPVSLLPTPSPGHSLVSTVQPPHPSVMLPLPSSSLLLPPPLLLDANSQPVSQLLPSWPAYKAPLTMTTSGLSKWKSTVSRVTDEVEWEQNTQEFLRKLQEPRTTELPLNRESGLSRSSSPSSSNSSERVKKHQQKKRSASKELWSRSHEHNTKRHRSEKVIIAEDRKSCDEATKMKQLSVLKEKLSHMKKDHSQLMSIRQKSSHTKEKLKLNRHQQDELHAHIQALLKEINCRSTEGYSGFVSNVEHSFGHAHQRESKVMTKQRTYPRQNSKEQRKKDKKKSSFTPKELEKKELSSKVITEQSSPQQEPMLSTGYPTDNTLVNVEVKAEESIEFTNELQSKKVTAGQQRANDHRKSSLDSVGDELKEKTNNRADEKSLQDKRDMRPKDEPHRSKIRYDYYDGGDNWCHICNSFFPKLSEFLDHLHCTAHQQVVATRQTSLADKPWKSLQVLQSKPHNNLPPISEPASGVEFLLAVKGFFCQLCQKFSGDCDDAELHVLSEEHNVKFKQHCLDNPRYKKRCHSAKTEKMAFKKLKKEKTLQKGETEKNLMSGITDSENNPPLAGQMAHMEIKMRKPSSETTTFNLVKPLEDVLTQRFADLKNSMEQSPKAISGNLLAQASESFANLAEDEALVFSNNTMPCPVVTKETDEAHILVTNIPTLLSSEIKNFDVNMKASSKREPALKTSIHYEADVGLKGNLNSEKDTIRDNDNRNTSIKPTDAGATEQTTLKIHLMQAPESVNSMEAASNESLQNVNLQKTVYLLDPVMPCDITNHLSDLNAECRTIVNETVTSNTYPVAVSEVQSVILLSGSSFRNANVYELAQGGELAQSCSTYLSHVELDEREDTAICQSEKPMSTELDEREDPDMCQSQIPSSTKAGGREDPATFQSQKPSCKEVEEREVPATCQSEIPSSSDAQGRKDLTMFHSEKPLSTIVEEMEDSAICQSQKPSCKEVDEREVAATCQSEISSSTDAEEMEDPSMFHSEKPLSTEVDESEDSAIAICQSQKPSCMDVEEREVPAIFQSEIHSSIEAEGMKEPAICLSEKPLSTEVHEREESQKPSCKEAEEKKVPAMCQSEIQSSTGVEDGEAPAICQSEIHSSIEVEGMDDPAMCLSEKPLSTEVHEWEELQKPSCKEAEEKKVPAMHQSEIQSSTGVEDGEAPAICQSEINSSIEAEGMEDPTICQSQKPFCLEVEEKEVPAMCQSEIQSSTGVEDGEAPAICQSEIHSSIEVEGMDDPAMCLSEKPLSTEVHEWEESQKPWCKEVEEKKVPAMCKLEIQSSIVVEEREVPAICRSEIHSSIEAEGMEDPAICLSEKPLSMEVEEGEDCSICQSQKPFCLEVEEKEVPVMCESEIQSSVVVEEREVPAICRSEILSSIEAEGMEDPAICISEKPLFTGVNNMEYPTISQSEIPSSMKTGVLDKFAIFQAKKPFSTEVDHGEDRAICQSQKPSADLLR